jgi:hypothetical protein
VASIEGLPGGLPARSDRSVDLAVPDARESGCPVRPACLRLAEFQVFSGFSMVFLLKDCARVFFTTDRWSPRSLRRIARWVDLDLVCGSWP